MIVEVKHKIVYEGTEQYNLANFSGLETELVLRVYIKGLYLHKQSINLAPLLRDSYNACY